MKRIKLLAVALMLSLAGVVYAAGNAQDTGKACCMDKAGCCANCCKSEKTCCKADKAGHKRGAGQSAQENKEKTCASCEGCKDGKSCCKDKAGKEGACATNKEASDCCAPDAGCCGNSCCAKNKKQ